MRKVALVGAGPGDPSLLTLGAVEALRKAEVLLYDALVSEVTLTFVPAECECIFVGKRGGEHTIGQQEIEALMISKARENKRVVRLKGGDPFVFGRGGEEAQALRAAGIPFEIFPGISSAIAAPAYAGIPLTHRAHASSFIVATGHENPGKAESALDWAKLADPHATLVFLMGVEQLGSIAQRLIDHGLSSQTPVALIQEGTRPSQRCIVGTLATIAQDAKQSGIAAPAIAVIGSVVTLRNELAWFDRAPLFGKRVLITRSRRQAEEFARALFVRGAEPIVAPTIKILRLDDNAEAERATNELASYAWLVFTSQSGVNAFFARLRARSKDARAIGRTKVAVIGAKTAERLVKFGVHADCISGVYTGEDLATELIERTQRGDRVLLFRAKEAHPALRQMLEEAGRVVVDVAAYETCCASDPEFAQKVARADILTFTSGSTVRGFSDMLGGHEAAVVAARGKLVACIGPITEDEARAIGMPVDVVSDVYTTEGLIAALESHLAAHP